MWKKMSSYTKFQKSPYIPWEWENPVPTPSPTRSLTLSPRWQILAALPSPVAYRGSTHWGGGTSGVMSQNIWGTIFARERSDRALGGGCPPPMVRSFILFRLENVQSGEYLRRKFRLDDMYYISKLVWNWILFWRASAPKPPPPPVRQWGAPSGNVCVFTSVASFLVLGGGGKTPKYTDKMYIIILREQAKRASASETYIFRTKNTSVYIYNQCIFLDLWYGAINDITL